MSQNDNRTPSPPPDIEPELVGEALQQLDAEIALLEEWIADLEKRAERSESTGRAMTIYKDKLRSRREMRQALLVNQKNHRKG